MKMRQTLFALLSLCLSLSACSHSPTVPKPKEDPLASVKLRGTDTVKGDLFGWSVATSADTLAIGAIGVEDSNAILNTGAVYLVSRKGKTWGGASFKLSPPTSNKDLGFGDSLALSDDTLIVGAPGDNSHGESSGAAYIFKKEGEAWVQEAKLTASNPAAGEHFGTRVALEGDTAVVGMWRDEDNKVDVPGELFPWAYAQGSVYVFTRQPSGWQEQARLIPSELTKYGSQDGFGDSLALSGDYLFIGAEKRDSNVDDSGTVYVFKRTGDSWAEHAQLTASDSVEEGFFGQDVALYADYAVIGAPGNYNPFTDSNPDNDFGAAYIFRHIGDRWLEEAKLMPKEQELDDLFASSVAILGERVLIGAPNSHETLPGQGSAFIFKRQGDAWVQDRELIAKDGLGEEAFAGAVALGHDYTVIGAPRACHASGCSAGAVYLY